MSDHSFAALRAAVSLARQHQIKTVAALRVRVMLLGYSEAEVDEALRYWAETQ